MWLWRGTQSAIFYYASLSPCFEYNHNRKRRKDAKKSSKERDGLEMSQPGLLRQPVSFQTNQYWAEEIQAGPGPPRGWRKHKLEDSTRSEIKGHKKSNRGRKNILAAPTKTLQNRSIPIPATPSLEHEPRTLEVECASPSARALPSGVGSHFDALKDTIKSNIPKPEMWNWKRYEREDETLFGINDKISRMWDRAIHQGTDPATDPEALWTHGRKRSGTRNSDDCEWRYAKNPGVNDLHPPIVSQVPRTKREVVWMMQPPPSRAVMEGKVRPDTERGERRPLCKIDGISVQDARSEPTEDGQLRHGQNSTSKNYSPSMVNGLGRTRSINADGADDEDDSDDGDEDRNGVFFNDANHDADDHHHQGMRGRPSVPPNLEYSPPTSSVSAQPSDACQLTTNYRIPPQLSPPQRPPLAVLVDPNPRTKIRSYQLPILPSSQPPIPESPSPRGLEVDVVLGVVLQKSRHRTRHSLPDVRFGERYTVA